MGLGMSKAKVRGSDYNPVAQSFFAALTAAGDPEMTHEQKSAWDNRILIYLSAGLTPTNVCRAWGGHLAECLTELQARMALIWNSQGERLSTPICREGGTLPTWIQGQDFVHTGLSAINRNVSLAQSGGTQFQLNNAGLYLWFKGINHGESVNAQDIGLGGCYDGEHTLIIFEDKTAIDQTMTDINSLDIKDHTTVTFTEDGVVQIERQDALNNSVRYNNTNAYYERLSSGRPDWDYYDGAVHANEGQLIETPVNPGASVSTLAIGLSGFDAANILTAGTANMAAPGVTITDVETEQFRVNITPPVVGTATGYKIWVYQYDIVVQEPVVDGEYIGLVSNCVVTGLHPNTLYKVQVSAYDEVEDSPKTYPANVTTEIPNILPLDGIASAELAFHLKRMVSDCDFSCIRIENEGQTETLDLSWDERDFPSKAECVEFAGAGPYWVKRITNQLDQTQYFEEPNRAKQVQLKFDLGGMPYLYTGANYGPETAYTSNFTGETFLTNAGTEGGPQDWMVMSRVDFLQPVQRNNVFFTDSGQNFSCFLSGTNGSMLFNAFTGAFPYSVGSGKVAMIGYRNNDDNDVKMVENGVDSGTTTHNQVQNGAITNNYYLFMNASGSNFNMNIYQIAVAFKGTLPSTEDAVSIVNY